MDDAALMCFFQSARDLDRQPDGALFRQCPTHGFAVDELHDEVVLADIVDLADMGMIQ